MYNIPASPEYPPKIIRYLSVDGLTVNVEYMAYRFCPEKSSNSTRSMYLLLIVMKDSLSLPEMNSMSHVHVSRNTLLGRNASKIIIS